MFQYPCYAAFNPTPHPQQNKELSEMSLLINGSTPAQEAVVFSIAQTYSVVHDPAIDSPPIPATNVHYTNDSRVVAHLEKGACK